MVLNIILTLFFVIAEKFFAGCFYVAREKQDIIAFGILSAVFESLAVSYIVMIIITVLGV